MDRYEQLVEHARQLGLEVIEKTFKSSAKGLTKGNKIGISKSIESNAEKRCVLAEEIAHSLYTVGDILDQNNINNVKQEKYARKKAYEDLLPLSLLIEAYEQGIRSLHEMAEYLEVTEDFFKASLNHYQRKYGLYARYGRYVLYFSPLTVCEKHHIKAI